MQEKRLEIRGLQVRILGTLKKTGKPYLHTSRIVSPEWIQLWFLISEDKFDHELWNQLSQKNQDFMGFCVHACRIKSPAFEKALSKSYSDVHKRLLLIEGAIQAGNLNRELVDEYKTIVERLADSFQIARAQAANLKKRIERTYEAEYRSEECH